jgi:hypothetical protein
MSKILLIDNLLLFKIMKVFKKQPQYLCVCSEEYKNELDMKIGDIIFIKDTIKQKSYKRLGEIKAFNKKNIIVSIMSDIGIGSKSKMQKLHYDSLNEEK